MKLPNIHNQFIAQCPARRLWAMAAAILLVGVQLSPAVTTGSTGSQKTFATPEDAVRALSTAVKAHDTNALAAIFGPQFDDIISPDKVQAQNELTAFGNTLSRSNRLDQAQPDRYILETGPDQWPFPIPIVRTNNAWMFDTPAGRDEIINRRVGRNELDALKSVRAYVEAQRDYASKDHTGNEVLKYAQKILSTAGTRDGLYWPTGDDGELSPLGPLVATAQSEGYLQQAASQANPQPFHGYYFKILTGQGPNAPGGQYDYIINGNMIGGFALVAWPAEYGESGVMTFIVNQQGKVYQKDLGPNTAAIVKDMKEYNPDKSWKLSPD
ncbi:MAG TPA: DUF2950 domain-containing protein [Verrucomicrobiae bacterium]|nr:DUF2950 domain-containing protein [Verrucomicrobiae bacterium]